MFRLILINLDKKLSFISIIFMFISLLLICVVTIFNAGFDVSDFIILNENEFYRQNYILESIQLIEIIEVLFIILLVFLELFHNTDNFDSYFISVKGKKKFFISKMLSYLILILFYTLVIFLVYMIVYLLRFNSLMDLTLMVFMLFYYIIYFILVFLVSYFSMLVFKNYFASIIVFLYYWIGKIIETKNEFLKVIFPKVNLNLINNEVTFNTNYFFVILFLIVMYFVISKIYEFKDLKVNS